MKAWDYLNNPERYWEWITRGVVLIRISTLKEYCVVSVDWNKFTAKFDDGSVHDMRSIMGNFKPKFTEDGDQWTGATRSAILDSKIMSLILDNRARNVLIRAGAEDMTVGEFMQRFSIDDLMSVQGCGVGVIEKVQNTLLSFGLQMRKFDLED